ncbi:MAG: hypothetical protein AAGF60_03360 [Pseudomonadota bacterium]
MENKLSASVGDPKSKVGTPKNKPKDIATLELWMIAQGANYTMRGKMNPDLIKWIRLYQGTKGKMRKENIDGIIFPGDKTWNAGAVNYFRYRDRIVNFQAYKVKEKGKEKMISVDEFVRLEIQARKKIVNNAKSVVSEMEMIEKLIRGIEETMAGQKGFVNAMVALGSSGFGLCPPPSAKKALDARGTALMVISHVDRAKPDWAKVKATVIKCQKQSKAAITEWKKYNDANMKRNEWGAFGATVVSEAAFGTLEVLATGYLVTTRGMDPKRAQVIAATGVEGLKVTAGEIGEYAANDKFDPLKSAAKVSGSMFIAGASAHFGIKLSGSAMGKVMGKVGKLAQKEFKYGFQKSAALLVQRIVEAGGENLIKSAMAEMGNTIKDVAGGKKVDEKFVIEKLANVLFGTLSGSAQFKSLKKFDNTWQQRSVRVAAQFYDKKLPKSVTLKLVATNPKHSVLTLMNKEGASITQEAMKKLSDTLMKTGYKSVESAFTGKETKVEELEAKAMKRIEKDSAFNQALLVAACEEAEKRIKKYETAQ